jgi:hypothetical protein
MGGPDRLTRPELLCARNGVPRSFEAGYQSLPNLSSLYSASSARRPTFKIIGDELQTVGAIER